ncbi:hypothetical protein C8R45DRAFT_927675 [Mycena sanguinolenta]|nr:hypothetical protein C8R45DRAFT_927675 [Mycena sanguinolenta]
MYRTIRSVLRVNIGRAETTDNVLLCCECGIRDFQASAGDTAMHMDDESKKDVYVMTALAGVRRGRNQKKAIEYSANTQANIRPIFVQYREYWPSNCETIFAQIFGQYLANTSCIGQITSAANLRQSPVSPSRPVTHFDFLTFAFAQGTRRSAVTRLENSLNDAHIRLRFRVLHVPLVSVSQHRQRAAPVHAHASAPSAPPARFSPERSPSLSRDRPWDGDNDDDDYVGDEYDYGDDVAPRMMCTALRRGVAPALAWGGYAHAALRGEDLAGRGTRLRSGRPGEGRVETERANTKGRDSLVGVTGMGEARKGLGSFGRASRRERAGSDTLEEPPRTHIYIYPPSSRSQSSTGSDSIRSDLPPFFRSSFVPPPRLHSYNGKTLLVPHRTQPYIRKDLLWQFPDIASNSPKIALNCTKYPRFGRLPS